MLYFCTLLSEGLQLDLKGEQMENETNRETDSKEREKSEVFNQTDH
jgi:hypothetical protein